ncbi:hypothetical protein EV421DRAFT_1739800 [Armillaria borealis]|uniref:Uncharacterized protein n=1 Tax=Armillaria borealis TaxID=47425 RepID=A0AA39J4S8_9AGAR|nr:hypothetical protein EV421DRAFT_1739800 [Armillaria borealis]
MARTHKYILVPEQLERPAKRKAKTHIQLDISPWQVDAHVSVAGGIANAALNAASIGWATIPRTARVFCRLTIHPEPMHSRSSSNILGNGLLVAKTFKYRKLQGSSVGTSTTGESIGLIAECLNRAHEATTSVVTVLENMVNQIDGYSNDI